MDSMARRWVWDGYELVILTERTESGRACGQPHPVLDELLHHGGAFPGQDSNAFLTPSSRARTAMPGARLLRVHSLQQSPL